MKLTFGSIKTKNFKFEFKSDYLECDSAGPQVSYFLLDFFGVDLVLLNDGLVLLHLSVLRPQNVEQKLPNQTEG